ncbi:MAG: hypothetical protein JRC77_04560, partial [Deltaproteobacteria bacterium]|nr:hypothetical protein [Deltaproteobacteria bacterium]
MARDLEKSADEELLAKADGQGESPERTEAGSVLRYTRHVLLAVAVLYPLMLLLNPEGIFDPLPGRITISVLMVTIWISTYLSTWAAESSRTLLSMGLWLLTTNHFALVYFNAGNSDHATGVLAMILVVSSLQESRLLLPYFGYVIVLAVTASLSMGGLDSSNIIPMTLTGCGLSAITVGAFTRLVTKLSDVRRGLEEKVESRTAELSTANESLEEQLRCARALNEITAQITAYDTPEPILANLAETTARALRASKAMIYHFPQDKTKTRAVSRWTDNPADFPDAHMRLFPVRNVPESINAFSREPIIVESYRDAPASLFVADGIASTLHETLKIPSILCFSFGHHDGECYLGILEVRGREHLWGQNAIEFIRAATHHVQIALQKMKLVDEWKHSQEALRQSEEQLRQAQKMESMGRLAGGIAHDFNNLLTAIRGYSSLVYDALESSNPLRSDVQEIEQASNRAARLVQQLLTFSRGEKQEPTHVDLNSLVDQLQPMLQHLIGTDTPISSDLTSDNAHILADPGQLEQALLNLALNAKDAMPKGGKLILRTSTQEVENPCEGDSGKLVLLQVVDTGCGMDTATIDQLFEPFFTTKEVGEGSGLGLSMVYGIVQQCQGDIQVESSPGHGTTFTLSFPQVSRTQSKQASSAAGKTDTHGKESILLVEDEPAILQLTARILRSKGYTVYGASNGRKALER